MNGAAPTLLHACDFYLCVSMADLVVYLDDDGDGVTVQPHLQATLGLLGLDVDIVPLYERFMRAGPRCDGDVHLFRSAAAPASLFGLDLYREATDSQDLVSLVVQCDKATAGAVATHLASLFHIASCQVAFERAHHSSKLRALCDPASYPRAMPDSDHMQHLLVHHVG